MEVARSCAETALSAIRRRRSAQAVRAARPVHKLLPPGRGGARATIVGWASALVATQSLVSEAGSAFEPGLQPVEPQPDLAQLSEHFNIRRLNLLRGLDNLRD